MILGCSCRPVEASGFVGGVRSSRGEGGVSILTGDLEHHRQTLALGRHRRQQYQNNYRNNRNHQVRNSCAFHDRFSLAKRGAIPVMFLGICDDVCV